MKWGSGGILPQIFLKSRTGVFSCNLRHPVDNINFIYFFLVGRMLTMPYAGPATGDNCFAAAYCSVMESVLIDKGLMIINNNLDIS